MRRTFTFVARFHLKGAGRATATTALLGDRRIALWRIIAPNTATRHTKAFTDAVLTFGVTKLPAAFRKC